MRIVVLDGHTLNPGDNPWTAVEALGNLAIHPRTPAAEVMERAQGADILLTNKVRLTEEIINALPDLKFISVLATGYDVVDIRAAAAKGIPVSNVPGYGTNAVAQHVFAMLLEMYRRVSDHAQSVRAGQWTGNKDWCYWNSTQLDLTGKTMGLVGFGNISRRVAEIALAFGMRVQAHVPRPKPHPGYENFSFCDLETLFATSDVISLHCPLTPENKGFVNAERIASMPGGAILINTARGPLVDEEAAAKALHAGSLGGLCTDVTSVEPVPADNPLLTAPNCLITPHLAWGTLTARETLMRVTAQNIQAFLSGNSQNVVNAHLL
ncbi:MAG: D-2-hydroxyacid dehydrogenase [Halodesulfovibrio sp.]